MKKRSRLQQSEAGFTLLEMLVVVIMIGVLSAIAVPGWLAFLNQQRLSSARNKALTSLRNAQVNAQRDKLRWQACFRDDGNQVLFSVERVPSDSNCQMTNGESLIENSNSIKILSSTFAQAPSGYYRIRFNHDGSVDGELGKITFAPRNGNAPKSCVIVETLLGSMRSVKDDKCD
ncbi:MAG: prepilin-type N-terminal cleavage/methylation domain-containing protein [Goleter apudmare HA4340-LM2]|jgi:prepilin-type N-terminal cleavage/methylation domain-containing protein|nr:prepilin-type N-terminal cleavage/methylation domain-containing protein [Goleter apudmare HA4340-LM2]